MRRDHVASTLIRRHFDIVYLLGQDLQTYTLNKGDASPYFRRFQIKIILVVPIMLTTAFKKFLLVQKTTCIKRWSNFIQSL